ncbi:uncharacterized protein MONOS_16322 [Monocercomonoides exilis]|uniref:uncharacterized protein n=1 Tax=Monocercomonoides exilis TaxID=2049356 RepID=UPI00355968E3|nr:hypothetical protein MONOS_16322 [Monocercomonoides exilis]|eukprot:MONOS_16322.1-p1 / transcript=MONOS_16322.1 / gene=MONOS_16322 / organism=Monocercomonoides_exilis_PA203 / gene_product=unspecified product / transcript_product=unspecified product / location=Mono_scaffold01647:1304-2212(-) / protein_length=120 / sequence_SO=supercontig / SO=protein_coding / is_pseudo=false
MSVMEHIYEECGSALRYDTVEGTFAVEKPQGGAGEHTITSPVKGDNERTARRRDVDVGEKDAGIGKSTKIGLEEAEISSSSTKKYVVEVKMLVGRRKERGGYSKRYDEEGEEGRVSEGE